MQKEEQHGDAVGSETTQDLGGNGKGDAGWREAK